MSDSPPPLPVDKNTENPQNKFPDSLSTESASATAFRDANAPQTNGGRVRAMSNAELAAFLENPPPLAVGQSWRDWLDAPAT